MCTKILECDGGSIKGLHVHLKSVHNIDLIKRKIGEGDSLNNTKKHSAPSYYNTRILEAIDQRIIQERYTDASVIIQYLHNPRAQLEKKAVVNKFVVKYYRGWEKMEKKLSMMKWNPQMLQKTVSEVFQSEDLSIANNFK